MNITSMLKDGVIIDAGANDGKTSLRLAQHFRDRLVLSIEPIQTNIKGMRQILKNQSNVHIIHGGLGSANKTGYYPRFLDRRRAGVQTGELKNYGWQRKARDQIPFPIYTVDDLVADRYKLAFAHWDVEGNEIGLLRGAKRTIMRDRPIFTLETFPVTNPERHASLLNETRKLEYSCTTIMESCGIPTDCRNLVCLPNEV